MMDFGDEMQNEQDQKIEQDSLRDMLARKNYEVVISGDINFSDFYRASNQESIENTMNDMLEHFTESEEYEKCANVLKALNDVTGKLKTV